MNNTIKKIITSSILDSSNQYLTIEPLEDNFQIEFSNSCNAQYSLNGGEWVEFGDFSPIMNIGDKLQIKGYIEPNGYTSCGQFYTNQSFNLLGNCNSLIFGDDTYWHLDLTEYQYCFDSLFSVCEGLKEISFNFLPALILGEYCYANMFQGCYELTTAPELPATILAVGCYSSMFQECSSLTYPPELPAIELPDNCYECMFSTCSSLIETPHINAIKVGESSCYGMFESCVSLKIAHDLPAINLESYCYANMFFHCTSLVTAPELPATLLKPQCYDSMFYGCTSLNYIKALFTYTSEDSISSWLEGVSSKGKFIKNKEFTIEKALSYTIPDGWDIESVEVKEEIPEEDCKYLTIIPLETIKIKFSNNCQYSYDYIRWIECNANTEISVRQGTNIYFKREFDYNTSSISIGTFDISGHFYLSGNCYSLLFNNDNYDPSLNNYTFQQLFMNNKVVKISDNFLNASIFKNKIYEEMFKNCEYLIKAPKLPAVNLTTCCYRSMFEGCTSLVNAPELPALELNDGCYYRMFAGCSSLEKAPDLPAETLTTRLLLGEWIGCYTDMFYDCVNLKYVKALFINSINQDIDYSHRSPTSYWLYNVSSKGTFIKNKNAEWDVIGPDGIPEGWTIEYE